MQTTVATERKRRLGRRKYRRAEYDQGEETASQGARTQNVAWVQNSAGTARPVLRAEHSVQNIGDGALGVDGTDDSASTGVL